MAGEYDNIKTGRILAADYVALTGGYAPSDTADTDLTTDLIGLNVSAAGFVKIRTSAGTIIEIYVTEGDNGTAPISQIYATPAGTAATLAAGII